MHAFGLHTGAQCRGGRTSTADEDSSLNCGHGGPLDLGFTMIHQWKTMKTLHLLLRYWDYSISTIYRWYASSKRVPSPSMLAGKYIFSLWDHCKDNEGIYENIYLLHANATNRSNKFNNIQHWCRNISNAVLTNTFYSAAEQLLENIASQQRAVSMPKRLIARRWKQERHEESALFKSHTCMFYHLPMHEVLQKVSTCFNWFPRELSFGDLAHGSPQKLPKH